MPVQAGTTMFKLAGRTPTDLGVRDGNLAPCPRKANCVSSQMEADVLGELGPHHIHPFKYAGSPSDAMTRLLAVLLARPRCRIITQSPLYVHAEFERVFLGMVDDAEFLVAPAEQLIHVRSASRIGYLDFGVNRARLEELREAFDDAD